MPSSFASSFSPIVESVIAADPRAVVDVGPGWSKYGLAAREYAPNLGYLTAVEVPEGRLNPDIARIQDAVYDEIIEADVRTLPGDAWVPYDLALLVDIVEHLEVPEGQALMGDMLAVGCAVLVSTPQVWMEQHDDVNPYETHVSYWRWPDFELLGAHVTDYSTPDSVIYLLRPEAPA